MAHPNVETIRRAYEAFDKADLETIQNTFAEDVQLHVDGRSPIAGNYKGRDEVLGFLGQIVALSDGTFKSEPHDILGSDDHVVVLSRATARRGEKVLDVGDVEVYHLSDGKVTEAWFLTNDTHGQDEFWS